ncbi:hypothetical protein [Streptomyces sp. NPDC126499]|uniref:hypothetical protein n=1 Tax=Streptomyces sp. NPDC126499 TaxID=3155314 RepID=UPI0033294A57
MSVIRRAAVVSVLAAALVTGAAGTQALAASAPASMGDFDGPGRGHDRPVMFGPFEIPKNGNFGLHWGVSNRSGGFGF